MKQVNPNIITRADKFGKLYLRFKQKLLRSNKKS